MKVFFSTTPKAKKKFPDQINSIFSVLKELKVVFTDDTIERVTSHEFYGWDDADRKKYYKNTINAIKKSEICIFEASFPSLGVGHLIGQSLKFSKPVIVLFVEGNKPFMLDSADDENVILVEYNNSNLKEELSIAIDYAKDKQDVRFNFFISPAIGNYLDWISKEKKIPRSVYLRGLIEKGMENNEEYNS